LCQFLWDQKEKSFELKPATRPEVAKYINSKFPFANEGQPHAAFSIGSQLKLMEQKFQGNLDLANTFYQNQIISDEKLAAIVGVQKHKLLSAPNLRPCIVQSINSYVSKNPNFDIESWGQEAKKKVLKEVMATVNEKIMEDNLKCSTEEVVDVINKLYYRFGSDLKGFAKAKEFYLQELAGKPRNSKRKAEQMNFASDLPYSCVCGEAFTSSQKKAAHCKRCTKHLDSKEENQAIAEKHVNKKRKTNTAKLKDLVDILIPTGAILKCFDEKGILQKDGTIIWKGRSFKFPSSWAQAVATALHKGSENSRWSGWEVIRYEGKTLKTYQNRAKKLTNAQIISLD